MTNQQAINILNRSAKNGIRGTELPVDDADYLLFWNKVIDNRTGDRLKSMYQKKLNPPKIKSRKPKTNYIPGEEDIILEEIPNPSATPATSTPATNNPVNPSSPWTPLKTPKDPRQSVTDLDPDDVFNDTTGGPYGTNVQKAPWTFKDALRNLPRTSGWNLTGNSGIGIGNTNGHAGLTIGGKNLGHYANAGLGIYNTIKAVQGLNSVAQSEGDRQQLLNKIRTSAAGNPMLSSYLTSDQMSQLNKIKRGYEDNSQFGAFNNLGNLLGGAGKGALMGVIGGGLPGAVLGGLGGLVNAGIDNQKQSVASNTQNLEGLYQALSDAEAQYKRMRTPNFTGLGLQSRYTNNWM